MSTRLSSSTSGTDRRTPCVASGQVTTLSDGNVEYRSPDQEATAYLDLCGSSQQEYATYQDLLDQPSKNPEGNASEYALYANESMNDNADYLEIIE